MKKFQCQDTWSSLLGTVHPEFYPPLTTSELQKMTEVLFITTLQTGKAQKSGQGSGLQPGFQGTPCYLKEPVGRREGASTAFWLGGLGQMNSLRYASIFSSAEWR